MENLVKGKLNDSSDYCKHYCDDNQHCCYAIQYLQKIDNQKATALDRGLWLLID